MANTTKSSEQTRSDGVSQTDSISISQVAFEIGIRITSSQCISVGAKVAKAYKDKHGEKPSKHNQTVNGQVMLVNSYMERDRPLLESAIRDIVK